MLGMMRGLFIDDMSNSPVTLDAGFLLVLNPIPLGLVMEKKPLLQASKRLRRKTTGCVWKPTKLISLAVRLPSTLMHYGGPQDPLRQRNP